MLAIDGVNVGAITQNPVGVRFAQHSFLDCRSEGNHSRSRSFSRPDTGGHIFEYNALRRGKSQDSCAFQIWLGVRFALRDVV